MTPPSREPPRGSPPKAGAPGFEPGLEAVEETRLGAAFASLDPTAERADQLEARLVAAFEAESRSLAAEWIDLFRVGPVRATARTLAAAASLAVITQLGLLVLSALLLP